MLLLTGNTVYMIITQELNEDTVYLLIQRLITCLAMSYFLKGTFINHVVKIWGIFDPPSFVVTFIK